MTLQEKSEWIEQYIEGKLSGQALYAFEKKMQEDADFAKEVALQKEVLEALAAEDVLALREQLESIRDRRRVARCRREKVAFILKLGSLAAAIMVLIATGFWLFQNSGTTSPAELFTSYFEPPSQLFASQGNERNGDEATLPKRNQSLDAFAKVETLYEAQKYQEALRLLRSTPPQIAEDFKSEVNYQMGILLLLNDQPDEAITHFSKVVTVHQDERDWYVALSLLKLGNRPADAKAAFEKIAGSKNPWREKAKEIVDTLTK